MTNDDLFRLLKKPGKLASTDLEFLRVGLSEANPYAGNAANFQLLDARLEVEIIDALVSLDGSIQKLDQSSTDLINTTNTLTRRILVLTRAAVIVGGLAVLAGFGQVVVGILQLKHH
jgi:hypothetical protein